MGSANHIASYRLPTCPPGPENFFWSVSGESSDAFDNIKHTSLFPKNAVIFVEGQKSRDVVVVSSGRLKLSAGSHEGKTLILRIAEPGDVLGLHASLSHTPHGMTVETMEPCTLEFVSGEDFWRFLKGHGDAALRVTEILSRECLEAYELTRAIGLSHSVSERFARFLLDRASDGRAESKSGWANLAMTHEEISQVVGTSRETITRLLTEFKRKDMVELKGSRLTIRNRPALESMGGASH